MDEWFVWLARLMFIGIFPLGIGMLFRGVPARDSAGALHHQCHRGCGDLAQCVSQRAHPQGDQDTRAFLQRRSSDQTDLAGAEKYHQGMGEAGVSLESGNGAIRNPVR